MRCGTTLGLVASLVMIPLVGPSASRAQDAPPPLEGPKDAETGGAGKAAPPDEFGILEDDGRPAIRPQAAPHEGAQDGPAITARARTAPPDPRRERPDPSAAPTPDARWIPGYWDWDAKRSAFAWVGGIWKVPPKGLAWVEGRWDRDEAGWFRVPGRWEEVASPGSDGRREPASLVHDVDRIGPPPERPASAISPEGPADPTPGGQAEPLDGLEALPEPAPSADDASSVDTGVVPTGMTAAWPPRATSPIDRVPSADPSAPRVTLPGRGGGPGLQGEPSLRPREAGPPEVLPPAATTAELADRLAEQSGRFYEAIAATSGDVPQAGEMLFESQQLRLAALELSRAASQGSDPNRVLAAAGQAEAWYANLSARVRGVAQGRTGPNIALVADMGQTFGQIRTTLGGQVSAPISPVSPTVAGPYVAAPVRNGANRRQPAPAGRGQAQQPRRGPIGRIGRLLRPR